MELRKASMSAWRVSRKGRRIFPFGRVTTGVDGAEAFGPRAAEEFHEDGFGLVVEGVGGEDGVGMAGGEEGGEEVVADRAGGFFDGFAGLGDAVRDVGLVKVEGNVEADAEVSDELLVAVGFCAAKAVMDVGGAQADAEGFARGGVGGVEGEEESDRVCAAGDGNADAVAGLDVGAIEGETVRHLPYVSWSVMRQRLAGAFLWLLLRRQPEARRRQLHLPGFRA